MSRLSLRPYQRESIDAIYRYWNEGGGNPLIVIPTGGGKSLLLATLCQELLTDYPSMRIGIVTHVKELVEQNFQELVRLWSGAPAGIYSASVGRRDTRSQILFMGIQSVHKKTALLGGFDLLLVDEAHLIPRNSDTMYGRFIDRCREIRPDMRIVGFTATPYRLDSGRLDDGKGAMFDTIVYEANVRDLIEAGYLSHLISKATAVQIDMTGAHRRGGEFVQSEMDERASIPTVVEAAVNEIIEYGKDRQGWIVFCTSVAHSILVRDAFRSKGISCESVTGDTPAGERSSIIRRFKERAIRCLTSVGVLTTGFNAPHVDLLAILRPTLSTGLYVQMVGRAFRLSAGKENALILDYAGNVERHGPVDDVRPRRMGAGKGKRDEEIEEEAEPIKVKACPHCKTHNKPSATNCIECDFAWPIEIKPKHKAEAEEAPILSTEKARPSGVPIKRVWFSRHTKVGSPDSMKVTYETDTFKSFSTWVCFEHQGFARDKAVSWWRRMGGKTPVPKTVTEALERVDAEIGEIIEITVQRTGQYKEVTSVKLSGAPHTGEPRVRVEYRASDMNFGTKRRSAIDPEREKHIDRIIALRDKTIERGCTIGEAEAAQAKAAELMAKYGINEREVAPVVF